MLNYKMFVEARFQDIVTFKNTGLTYNNIKEDQDFVSFITLNKRINNEKIRLKLTWNNTCQHDLKDRIFKRSSIKSISELNILVRNALNELYSEHFEDIYVNRRYTIYFKEYNFSLIFDKYDNKLNFLTILSYKNSKIGEIVIDLNTTL